MALAYTFSSTATLAGARNLNRSSRMAAQEDLGGKVQLLISAVNLLQTALSTINTALVSAANSGVSFSAFSTAPVSTMAALSNFRS
jgi:hypothetical protein